MSESKYNCDNHSMLYDLLDFDNNKCDGDVTEIFDHTPVHKSSKNFTLKQPTY